MATPCEQESRIERIQNEVGAIKLTLDTEVVPKLVTHQVIVNVAKWFLNIVLVTSGGAVLALFSHWLSTPR